MSEDAGRRWYRGVTRYQWLVLAVAWLGWVFDIMDTALFNFAKGPMLAELLAGATPEQTAYIEGRLLTVFLIGWSVGGLFFGVLADRWGRTRTMIVTILIYTAFTGLHALCQSWEQLAVVRFITALGIGGEWAAGAALIAEVFPNKARAPAAALLQSAAAFGPVLAGLANLAIPAKDWRWLFLVGIVPALVTVAIRFGVKEPERWTHARARQKGSFGTPIRELFSHPIWRRHAIVALALGVVGIAGAQNISFWLPNMVKAVNAGLSADAVQARTSYVTFSMHAGTLLGVLLVPWLCERFGRRPTILAFFLLSPLSILAATSGGGTYERLLLLAPLMSFFTIGVSAAFVLYFPELFPTSLRATGAGMAYNVGRIFAAGVPLLTAWFMGEAKGSPTEGVMRTALVLGIGIVVIPFAPETKGKALPEG